MKSFLLRSNLIILFVLFAFSSCKEDVGPLTGDLKITFQGSTIPRIYYELYTEGSLSADVAVRPLLTGEATSNTILIQNLNPGNYILMVGGNYKSVQVTAGREREFEF